MKSRIFVFAAVIAVALTVFSSIALYSCNKTAKTPSQKPNAAALLAEEKNEDVNCSCPAQSTCNTDCKFGSCCICWNPGTHEGACGCLLGFPSCKSAKIEAGSLWRYNDPDVSHEVTIRPSELVAFFNWLDNNSLDASSVEAVYDDLVLAYNIQPTDISVLISIEDYVPFVTAYENFISGLSAADIASVENYINN